MVPGKTTLPVLTNVLLEADPGDGLRLVATNLDLTVSRRVRAIVTTAGRTTVPARLLADYVALLDRGKQVLLNLTSNGTSCIWPATATRPTSPRCQPTTFLPRQL